MLPIDEGPVKDPAELMAVCGRRRFRKDCVRTAWRQKGTHKRRDTGSSDLRMVGSSRHGVHTFAKIVPNVNLLATVAELSVHLQPALGGRGLERLRGEVWPWLFRLWHTRASILRGRQHALADGAASRVTMLSI